jgi:formylmethanofuran:tetrahydromethanopterin formyltransferase
MSIVKIATQMITMPTKHLKNDHKELEDIRQTAKKIEKQVDGMEADDKETKKKYLKGQ